MQILMNHCSECSKHPSFPHVSKGSLPASQAQKSKAWWCRWDVIIPRGGCSCSPKQGPSPLCCWTYLSPKAKEHRSGCFGTHCEQNIFAAIGEIFLGDRREVWAFAEKCDVLVSMWKMSSKHFLKGGCCCPDNFAAYYCYRSWIVTQVLRVI